MSTLDNAIQMQVTPQAAVVVLDAMRGHRDALQSDLAALRPGSFAHQSASESLAITTTIVEFLGDAIRGHDQAESAAA